ncbi:MAG: hypothetical protein R3279_01865 [Putridiphycobacter sp.]|nr:hypothetical protein [Putridiphycobacter sp.]
MKATILQSDLKRILHLLAPVKYQLFIFDPFNRLIEDETLSDHDVIESTPKVLVNLSNQVVQYKELKINDFDLVVDFGRSELNKFAYTKQFHFTRNTDGSIRWFFSKGKIKTALSFYNNSSWRSKLLASGLFVANKLRLGRFVGQGTMAVYSKNQLKIENAIAAVEYDDYAIFTGSEGYGRTAVVAISNKGAITHYAKLAYDLIGKKLMENERIHLRSISLSEYKYIKTPTIVAQNDPNVLITSNITPKKSKRSSKFAIAQTHFVATVFHASRLYYKIANTQYWDEVLNNISFINSHNIKPELQTVSQLLLQVKEGVNANRSIITTMGHGDFTPWNLKFDQNNIYVYDWEYAKLQVPALFDLFHFHFQTGLFVKNQTFEQILEAIEYACKEIEIAYIIDQYKIDLQFYIKLYLIKAVSFQIGTLLLMKKPLSSLDFKKIALYEKALSAVAVRSTDDLQRAVFIKELYAKMKPIPHAMLKFVAGKFEQLAERSDLDISVRKKDVNAILKFAKNHLFVHKTRITQKSFMTIVELFFKDGSFLSIDLICQFKRKGLEMMSHETLIKSAEPNAAGIMVPSKQFDLEYAFLFYTLNRAELPIKYYHYFQSEQGDQAFNYINEKYKLNLPNYESLYKVGTVNAKSVKKIVKNQEFQKLGKKILNAINYYRDTLKSILQSSGFIVTFSGVDGAGKSTILDLVEQRIQAQFRKEVVRLRHRPGILPILSAIKHGGVKNAEKRASEKLPRTGTNGSTLSSFLRFSYYFTDYIIGQVYVYFKYIIRGKIVLYDRYYFDFIADCERSNIRLNKRLIKALYFFISKPKLNVLLWADANVIYKRKQELEISTISKLTQDYKNLFRNYHQRYSKSTYKVVKNVNIDFTVSTVMRAFANAI